MLWSFSFSHPPDKLRESVFFFKIQVLRDIKPFRFVNICRRFQKLQCLQLHGQEVPRVRNVCNDCPVDTTVHLRILETSATPPWQHQISQFALLFSAVPPPANVTLECENFLSLSEKIGVVKLNVMFKKKNYMHMVVLPSWRNVAF
jgi:hypothetical protein